MSPEAKAAKATKTEGKAKAAPAAPKTEKAETKESAPGKAHTPRVKPKLTDAQKVALGLRAEKDENRPAFRRHEWWRYKKLGGTHAPWRLPRGIHSKVRRHFGYRPPLVSIGYRGPVDVRGLHPSGFQEVLVHNQAELQKLDKATQAARIGGTVGGRKAELITKDAAKLGIRVLNPYGGN